MATRYVVDTSVLGHYLYADTYTPEVRELVAMLCRGELELHIPEFSWIECANILWKQVRFRGLSQTSAEQILVELLAIPFQIVSVSNLLPRALGLGLTHQLAVYDSLYIALALELDCPLITVDQRQGEAAARSGVMLKAIADFSPAE